MIESPTKLFTALMNDAVVDADKIANGIGRLANLAAHKKHRIRAFKTIQQGYRCYYCRNKLTLDRQKDGERIANDFATFEHLVDVFSGGGQKDDAITKIVIACRACNFNRGQHQERRARAYYGSMFAGKYTLLRLIEHPKVGWAGIIREFGPIPDDFDVPD